MTPDLTKSEREDQKSGIDVQELSFDGRPKTDSDSKTVVIAAERHDRIDVVDVAHRFKPAVPVPSQLKVIRKEHRYYGPELLVHNDGDDSEGDFLITAPGPTSQLRLWIPQESDGKRRSGWTALADIQATLAAEQPPYELCEQCGEEIRTIEHDRMSTLGRCQR